MNRKIVIQSKQIFESHEDFVTEENDAEVIVDENSFEVSYEGSKIKFCKDKLIIERDNMVLEICLNENTTTNYNTPYGAIDIEVCGREFYFNKEPFLFRASYEIKFGNNSEYLNELQISFKD